MENAKMKLAEQALAKLHAGLPNTYEELRDAIFPDRVTLKDAVVADSENWGDFVMVGTWRAILKFVETLPPAERAALGDEDWLSDELQRLIVAQAMIAHENSEK